MVDSSSPTTSSLSFGLLCHETPSFFAGEGENEEEEEDLYDFIYKDRVEDNEYVQILIERELTIHPSHPKMVSDWIKQARLESIQWSLNTRALFRFQFRTAYLAITYFDRFLSQRMINSDKYWAVQILSIACLSLAAKLEERKVPSLTDFPMEDVNFEGKVIMRMELLVLNTLEWKMNSVTPFDYLHYIIPNFCKQSPPKDTVARIIELIFATTKDINLTNYRPCVVAATATLLALDQKLTKEYLEFKIKASSCGFLEIEDVFSCYSQMQELAMEKIRLPQNILSPNLSPDVFGNTSVTSAASNKRKRLEFNDSDHNKGIPDENNAVGESDN